MTSIDRRSSGYVVLMRDLGAILKNLGFTSAHVLQLFMAVFVSSLVQGRLLVRIKWSIRENPGCPSCWWCARIFAVEGITEHIRNIASKTTCSLPDLWHAVYGNWLYSSLHTNSLVFFTLPQLFWSKMRVKGRLYKNCGHMRVASTVAQGSFSTAWYFCSSLFNVWDIYASGQLTWDNITAMA